MKDKASIAAERRKGRKKTGWWRWMAALLLLAGTAGAILWLLLPPPKDDTPPPPPRIEVAGTLLQTGGDDPVGEALDLVRRYARRDVVIKLPSGETRPLKPARLGAEIDRVRLAELVNGALDAEAPLGRAHLAARLADPEAVLALPVPIRIDTARAVRALVAIKEDVDRDPSDAVVDLEKKQLQPEQYGYRLDVYGTVAALDAALRNGRAEADAVVDRLKPRVLAAQLGNVKFDAVLGYFETRYNRARRYKDRTYNLRLAATKLDGTVLMPGETFDFNERVGPRDEANGYRVAPVIAQGELVDGIGGGTCQISGTLHGAAFFAGLGIAERSPHSRPSSYIKLGMDAAVAYPTINFKLKNPFSFPVVLHETVADGRVRAEILGPNRKHTVTFFRRIDEILPFEELERETNKLEKGKRQLSQRGVPGFKTTVYRLVRDGSYAVRHKRVDHYPPTAQIVWVGTGDKSRGRLKQDRSPEYTADEYLVVTQGPNIRGKKGPIPGGGMVEARTRGRTGSPGWQKKEGLPVFESDDDEDDD